MPQLTDLELTTSFLTLAEELNFRRSAERLNIDQSALSRRIQRLERQLGYTLFERTTREVSLTPAGRVFFEENARLLQEFKRSIETARLVARGQTGRLRVGYMSFAATELMPHTVRRFQEKHPDVGVGLRYMRTQGQKLALVHDEIDVGYMIGPFEHSEFHTLTLRHDPLFVVAPRGHPLTDKESVAPADLVDQAVIMGDMGEWETYRWQLNELFAAEGVELKITFEATNTLALLGLVSAGLGVTVYPRSALAHTDRAIDCRPIAAPRFTVETILAWKRLNRSKLVQQFVECAQDAVASHLNGRMN